MTLFVGVLVVRASEEHGPFPGTSSVLDCLFFYKKGLFCDKKVIGCRWKGRTLQVCRQNVAGGKTKCCRWAKIFPPATPERISSHFPLQVEQKKPTCNVLPSHLQRPSFHLQQFALPPAPFHRPTCNTSSHHHCRSPLNRAVVYPVIG